MSDLQWTVLTLAVLGMSWMLGAYNRLQRLRNVIGQAVQQIDDPVRRRDELIAGLLTLLRPMADRVDPQALHAVDEAGSALLGAADALKAKPCSAEPPVRLALAEVSLQAALSQVIARIESEPTLRLQPGMLERLAGISEAERRLRFGRQLYNESVKAYNAALRQWPTRLLQRLFGLGEAATI